MGVVKVEIVLYVSFTWSYTHTHFSFSQLFPFRVIGWFDIKHCGGLGMLNDIVRENTVKDRLEELRMLSVSGDEMCVSGSFENKEHPLNPFTWSIFGGGKVVSENRNEERPETTKHEVESLPTKKRIKKLKAYPDSFVEVHTLQDDYLVIHLWTEQVPRNIGNPDESEYFELRYYDGETDLRYFIGKTWHPIEECKLQYYETAKLRYKDILSLYQVIQQQQDYYGEELTEIRRINKDDTEELWQHRNNAWQNITKSEDYEV